ncbi:glycosyltransferase [Pseudoalteromonas sp. NC201]|uniref:glycosyltransferase n=1 Tax=Pseudoalteromonas sp. NC201 TaxID=1514074 RepID=UPI000C7A60EE|nr:glycosyltransferase [Pseudoalteromonas sp. NC201]AUJ69477.1 putative glycosyltransferase EpsJ [Pseudoalteromonas sp. NC201]
MSIKYSIITPIYNAEMHVEKFTEHVINVLKQFPQIEWIIVDDGSQDKTKEIIQEKLMPLTLPVQLHGLEQNRGPGTARNFAIDNAIGDWLLFVDSDDTLCLDGLGQLLLFNSSPHGADIISFCWSDSKSDQIKLKKDRSSLVKEKTDMLSDYLALKMDGSVIFSAVQKDLIKKNNILFSAGYHEDVDFLFKLYWKCRDLTFLDERVYIKNSRDNSIVNSISTKHVYGFFRAFDEMWKLLEAEGQNLKFQDAFHNGLIALVATRIRNTKLLAKVERQKMKEILLTLRDELTRRLPTGFEFNQTQYHQITKTLLSFNTLDSTSQQQMLLDEVNNLSVKTWSCKDLEHSLFLAPDQVRACCKRFFINNEIRGDVVLIDNIQANVSIEDIQKAKKALKTELNSGESTACDGCPYLEFKQWDKSNMDYIKYLSLEHHSVCNLKCSYCSEKYYGGKKPTYDLMQLLDSTAGRAYLYNCETIIWGGGEPSLGREFDTLLPTLLAQAPTAIQRVLTNSIKYSDTLFQCLDNPNVRIVTSIDAGTDHTFEKIRGKSKLNETLQNLAKYAKKKPENITIKYILRNDNSSHEEIQSYLDKVTKGNIFELSCFQISCDFNSECLTDQVVFAATMIFGGLRTRGHNNVFFDDLLIARLATIDNDQLYRVKSKLALYGFDNYLADPEKNQKIILWGTGWQAKFLVERSLFFNKANIEFFIIDQEYKNSEKFMGYPVYTPEKAASSALPIIIAASQSYQQIKNQLTKYNIPESRLFDKVIF